jgi:hypothetical protein
MSSIQSGVPPVRRPSVAHPTIVASPALPPAGHNIPVCMVRIPSDRVWRVKSVEGYARILTAEPEAIISSTMLCWWFLTRFLWNFFSASFVYTHTSWFQSRFPGLMSLSSASTFIYTVVCSPAPYEARPQVPRIYTPTAGDWPTQSQSQSQSQYQLLLSCRLACFRALIYTACCRST